MRMSPRLLLAALGAVLLLQVGCSSDPQCPGDSDCIIQPAVCGNGIKEPGEECDDNNTVGNDGCEADCTETEGGAGCGNGIPEAGEACDDGNHTDGDGCESNCTVTPGPAVCGNGVQQEGEACDDGNTTSGDGCEANCTLTPTTFTRCAASTAPPLRNGATCAVTKAGNGARLFTGVVLKDGETLLGGQVLVNEQGVITCSACDCSAAAGAAEATAISCPTGVISPGLINPHDHITYQDLPYVAKPEAVAERFEHRNDWRRGKNGHTEVKNNGSKNSADILGYAELRQVMAGTTSIAGAGGTPGFLRNLDVSAVAQQEGLGEGFADSDTFPLGDSGGDTLSDGCSYPSPPASSGLPKVAAYLPHVSEGIASTALNEFRCVSAGSSDVLFPRTAIIHGIGVTAKEISKMAARGTGLIWSPRSNIALYGDTAMAPTYARMGVSVALGTDWLQSGSMNVLRELKCADYLNSVHFGHALTDEQLWRMTTANAADATDVFEKVGRLAQGKVADLAIFRLRTFFGSPHRAVVVANPEDVVLTVRGGKVLYGDNALMASLKGSDSCDTLDVCGVSKSVCVQSEVGKSLSALQSANANAYPLFACGTPKDEPVCEPRRNSTDARWPAVVNNSTTYSGAVSDADTDGDGVPNATDNCPTVFNPVRPMDNGAQADSDGDKVGDACDPCPLAADSTQCQVPDPADDDGDGVPTWSDNCPFLANPDQADTDGDGKGDACDGCPQQAGGTCATTDPSDPDLDGITSPGDNCPYTVNPDQKDTDGDAQGDACDPCPVANPNGAACPSTIYDLKTPVNGGIALVGSKVALTDVIVTGVNGGTATNGYFVQVYPPPQGKGVDYSGIYVFGPKAGIAEGDRLDITGATLKLYFGLLELTDVTFTKRSSGNALPPPEVVSSQEIRNGGARAAALEGALVEMRNVFATTPETSFREFNVDENKDSGTGVLVDDQIFSYPTQAVGNEFRTLRGVLTYAFNLYRVLPRSTNDMLPRLPPLPALTGFSGGGFVRVGTATGSAFPQALTVTMASTYPVDVPVTVTSGDTSALEVAGSVVIPAGQTSAEVKLTPHTAAASVTLTATVGTSSLTTHLRVLGADEASAVTGLTPTTVALVPGGKARLTVALDPPAPANTTLTLSADPAELGTLPATLAVPQDASQVSFDFTVDAATSLTTGTVTAALGASSASATVTVKLDVPRLASLTPDTAVTLPSGGTQEFTVTLDRAATEDTVVTLAAVAANAAVPYGTVPATVTVATGQTTATFTFTSAQGGEGAGEVSASLDGLTRATSVTVLPPPPKLATLSPATATVVTNTTFQFTVTLDRAAPNATTEVALSLDPATGVGTVPATVAVAEGQTTATFTFKADAVPAPAQATLTATFGGVSRTATVAVTVPAGTGLVINEIDYDQTGTDTKEFVEIYNGSGKAVSLDKIYLVGVNGSGTPTSYLKIDLSSIGTLGVGEYLVVGHASVVDPLVGKPGVKTLTKPATDFQNGAPDAVALYDGTADRLIDSLSYEGKVSQATIAGTTTKFDMQEGDADTTNLADLAPNGATYEASLARVPNGQDTNVNATDFKYTAKLTPGAANEFVAPPATTP